MRTAMTGLVALMLAGCGGTAEVDGVWKGDCVLSGGGEESTMVMTLDLGSSDGETIVGDGTVGDATYGDAPVEITGTIDGKDVALEIVYNLPTLGTTNTTGTDTGSATGGFTGFDDFLPTLGVDASVKGDEMEGTCSISVMGFAVSSDILLTRG